MDIVKFESYTPPGPSKYGVELSDMDGDNSSRSETGHMNRDRVRAGIYKLKLGWTNLTMAEVDALLKAIAPESVSTTFYFGGNVTTNMYAGNRTIDLKTMPDGSSYWDVSFDMVEM